MCLIFEIHQLYTKLWPKRVFDGENFNKNRQISAYKLNLKIILINLIDVKFHVKHKIVNKLLWNCILLWIISCHWKIKKLTKNWKLQFLPFRASNLDKLLMFNFQSVQKKRNNVSKLTRLCIFMNFKNIFHANLDPPKS